MFPLLLVRFLFPPMGMAADFMVFLITVMMFMVVFMSVHHAIMGVSVEKLIMFALVGMLVV